MQTYSPAVQGGYSTGNLFVFDCESFKKQGTGTNLYIFLYLYIFLKIKYRH